MRKLLCCFLSLFPLLVAAQEICDNGIDDDHDNKVDLLDPDCNCDILPVHPVDAFVNPSFENISGIFDQPDHLFFYRNHLTGWFNPLITTSFYFHRSRNFTNYMDNFGAPTTFPDVPLPIPDGDGIIGLQEFVPKAYKLKPKATLFLKSYIATCLKTPLEPGNYYQLDFDLGFGVNQTAGIAAEFKSESPHVIAIYALDDCSNVPKNESKNLVECLAEMVPRWKKITSVKVEIDAFGWKHGRIRFTVPEKYTGFAIGPDCPTKWELGGHLYYLDNLKLFRASMPKLEVIPSQGSNFCIGENPSITLGLASSASFEASNIQWYRNGRALAGEKGPRLSVTSTQYGEANYQCRVVNDTLCMLSDQYTVKWSHRPKLELGPDTTLCISETMWLEPKVPDVNYTWHNGSKQINMMVSAPGTYKVTVSNSCATVSDEITISYQSCELKVNLPTAFTPNHDGKNDLYRIKYNHFPRRFRMIIYNRYGQKVFESTDAGRGWDGSIATKPAAEGTYVCIVEFGFVGRKTERQSTSFVLLR